MAEKIWIRILNLVLAHNLASERFDPAISQKKDSSYTASRKLAPTESRFAAAAEEGSSLTSCLDNENALQVPRLGVFASFVLEYCLGHDNDIDTDSEATSGKTRSPY